MSSVVCLGLATLDVVHRVDVLPAPGRKGWAHDTQVCAGGPAANAAVTAAHLLGEATLVTALGAGPAADLVRADLEAHGVRVVDVDPHGQVPVASAAITPDGERTVVSPGARTSSARLDDAARAVVRGSGVLLVDGHHPDAAQEALAVAGGLRVLDAGSAKPRAEAWLGVLDVVAGSADYAAGLGLGLTADEAMAHVLGAGARMAVLTDGAGPARWATPTASGTVTPPAVEAVDTLGAGDAFHGALAAALARGRGPQEAVRTAVEVASRRVASVGARSWLDAVPTW